MFANKPAPHCIRAIALAHSTTDSITHDISAQTHERGLMGIPPDFVQNPSDPKNEGSWKSELVDSILLYEMDDDLIPTWQIPVLPECGEFDIIADNFTHILPPFLQIALW